MKNSHGILIPLSAIHSKKSAGIGEFLDLIPLIDWCRSVGFGIIQLLPLNDSADDPSPYHPISSCALNPLYLSLHALPSISNELKKRLDLLQDKSTLSKVPYKELIKEKLEWLTDYYHTEGENIISSEECTKFLSQNPWLFSYAIYKNKTLPNLHLFLQFLAYQQLKKVKAYAEKNDLLLMGDIPILISKESLDVQNHPEWFHTDITAGAPPDVFNAEGQSWGFPTYNWEAMKADGYSWWKNRLQYAAHFYHLFRIDHIVGLFRIWAIPEGKPSREGHFIPEDASLWIPQGRKRLMMIINASSMLPIGEDLGVVPNEVRQTMAELGVCSTKVIRWERNWETDRSFIPFEKYPVLSLTTLSTHDTETVTLWWQNKPEEAKAFAAFKNWNYSPSLSFTERFTLLCDAHHTPSHFHINLLQEYLSLFPELIWPNPEDERINIIEKPYPDNWLYRYRPSLEELNGHAKLKEKIKAILE